MYQAQRQGRALMMLLAVGGPFLLWVKPSGAAIVWSVILIYVAAPLVVLAIDFIQWRRREMLRVPRAVVTPRRRR